MVLEELYWQKRNLGVMVDLVRIDRQMMNKFPIHWVSLYMDFEQLEAELIEPGLISFLKLKDGACQFSVALFCVQ